MGERGCDCPGLGLGDHVRGQEDGQDSPRAAWAAVRADANRAVVFLYHLLRDPQPEAIAGLLGGLEGLEQMCAALGANAAAIVGHGHADTWGALTASGIANHAHFDPAALRHRVQAVGQQVPEDLADLALDALDALVRREISFAADLLFAQLGGQQRQHALQRLRGVELGDVFAAAGEAQRLLGDLYGAFDFLGGLLDVLAHGGIRRGFALCEVKQVHHRIERVVDLVGDGGCEASQAGELFAVHQRRITVNSLLPRMVACEMVASIGKSRPSLLRPCSVMGDCIERLVEPLWPNSWMCRRWASRISSGMNWSSRWPMASDAGQPKAASAAALKTTIR